MTRLRELLGRLSRSPVALCALTVLVVFAHAATSRCGAARDEARAVRVRDESAQLDASAASSTSTETTRRRERTEYRPDGSVAAREVEVSDEHSRSTSAARTHAAVTTHAAEEATRKVDRRANLRLELRAGWHPRDLGTDIVRAVPPVLDVGASARVLGPAWLGVWYRRDRAAPRELRDAFGVSVAFER